MPVPLTILSDAEVRKILLDLNTEDVINLQASLSEALHEYSTGDTNAACCANYQPEQTVLKRKENTSIFLPASTGKSVGVKVVTFENGHNIPKQNSIQSPPSKKSSVSSASTGLEGLTLSPASTMSTSDSRSSISGDSFLPPPDTTGIRSTTPKGVVSIMDSEGNLEGIINAQTLTAFRTALSATYMLQKRNNVHTITVFGAGKQAYWHIRLALLLRANDIHHINIINRSFESAVKMMQNFQPKHGGREEWSHVKFNAMSPEFGEYGRLLKDEIRKADIIFCCTPSTSPLFPHEFLTSNEGRRKGRYIAAIGSYATHMIELHPEILRVATKAPDTHHRHFHKHARNEGVIIVDTLDGCLKYAGEVVQAKLTPDQLVEVGELMMLKKEFMAIVEKGEERPEKGLYEWITKGNVIYKSVGLGLMDLVVGSDVIKLGKQRGVGTTIENF